MLKVCKTQTPAETHPNTRIVSIKEPKLYKPDPATALKHPSGRPVRVVTVDVGLKYNQLRCLVRRGVEVLQVPWDYDFPALAGKDYDGLFISNGPGDPAAMDYAVQTVKVILNENKPMFGICLGHQLLALANDIPTYKMHHGHRGLNHPVLNLTTGKAEITTQNHGFGVDPEAVKNAEHIEITHMNLNDNSIEGIKVKGKSAFSVQYHPESTPGPNDSRYLFDDFIQLIKESLNTN